MIIVRQHLHMFQVTHLPVARLRVLLVVDMEDHEAPMRVEVARGESASHQTAEEVVRHLPTLDAVAQ